MRGWWLQRNCDTAGGESLAGVLSAEMGAREENGDEICEKGVKWAERMSRVMELGGGRVRLSHLFPDAGNPGAGRANDAAVNQNCGNLIPK